MMLFSVDHLELLKDRAGLMANDLKHREKNGYERDMQIAYIMGHLQEVCALGYGSAHDEVSSTPWEIIVVHLSTVAQPELDKLNTGRLGQPRRK